MLLHLGNFTLFAFVLINIIGLTLLTGIWLRNAWLAISSGPLILCTIFFGIECYHGLGNISWMLPLTTLLSFYLIWDVEQAPDSTSGWSLLNRWKHFLPIESWREALAPSRKPAAYITFILMFLYSMSWRYVHPDIDKQTELIADLSYICSYLSGKTIPTMDYWFPPLTGTHYYSFQYYGAGFLGRMFQLEPGVTYNVSFAVMGALCFTTGIGAIFCMAKQWWVRLLVSAHLLWGGPGVTLFIYLFKSDPYLWDFMRFIGNSTLKGGPLSSQILGYDYVLSNQELPSENLGYCVFLGDFHPVLMGFYLLGYTVLVGALWTNFRVPSLMFLFGAIIPWTIVGNTWSLPIAGMAMLGFLAYHFSALLTNGMWKAFALGGIVCALMLYPFLRHFTSDSGDIQQGLELVLWDRHTPVLSFCLFLLPTLGLIVFGMLSGRSVIFSLSALLFIILMFTEFVFMHDEYYNPQIYGGGYDARFNSCLKWWPCVSELTLIIIAPLILDGNLKFPNFWAIPGGYLVRDNWLSTKIRKPVFTLIVLFLTAYPILFINEYRKQFVEYFNDKAFRGHLNGSDYLTSGNSSWDQSDQNVVTNLKLFLEQISTLPRSYVFAEHPEGESFTENGALTLFSNHPCFMGWIGHEDLWRGGVPALRYRYDTLNKIYDGEMPDAGPWLDSQNVDIILWFKRSFDKDNVWEAVNKSMQPNFRWREFVIEGDGHHLGYWENQRDHQRDAGPR